MSPKPAPQQSSTKRSKAAATPAPQRPVTLERPAVGRLIAVANQKGGVGKSTTAVSLGAALAELGQRVLVVDLDPQGNASTGLGIRHEAREVTVYDVLASRGADRGSDRPHAGREPVRDPLDDRPGGRGDRARQPVLARASPAQGDRAAHARRRSTSSSSTAHPRSACSRSTPSRPPRSCIVPIQCEYYALEGLGQLLRNVRLVQQNVNTGLRLTGIVMTMFDPRTKLSEQVVQEVRRYFGDRVYERSSRGRCGSRRPPASASRSRCTTPSSRGAESYRRARGRGRDASPRRDAAAQR